MHDAESHDRHLRRLRQWRNKPQPDQSMAFVQRMFKQKVERPHKQLAGIIEAWGQLLDADLLAHTRLESFRRGTLKVAVSSNARLYTLDRLLREGLEQQLKQANTGHAIRRVQLVVGVFEG